MNAHQKGRSDEMQWLTSRGSTALDPRIIGSLRPLAFLQQNRSGVAGERLGHPRRPVGAPDPTRKTFEIEIDDRRRVQRQPLRNQEPTNNRDAERTAQFGTRPLAERYRQSA